MAERNFVKIEALNRENYDTWKMQMEAILIKNDSLGYVQGKIPKPSNETDLQQWVIADSKAKADLILAISPTELKQIKDCETSAQVWERLKSVYQSKGPARKATLLKRLILSKAGARENITDHVNNFFDVVDKLQDLDVEINRDLLAIMLLYSLPDDYDNFRVAIESRDVLPTPEALKVKILEEFEARKEHRQDNFTDAFLGRQRFRDSSESTVYHPGKFPFKCNICKTVGHKAKFCPNKGTIPKEKSAHIADELGLNVMEECFLQKRSTLHEEKWCLDSGCTSHMSKDPNKFVNFNRNVGKSVNLADKSSTVAMSKDIKHDLSRRDTRRNSGKTTTKYSRR